MTKVNGDIATSTVYFASPGKGNTEKTLELARRRAEEIRIRTVLVATTQGDTALRAVDVFQGYKVIAVSHSCGYKEPNTLEVTEEKVADFRAKGGILLTTGHAFAGINRAIRKSLLTYPTVEVIAETLRKVFSPGLKVVCEIALMAADAGLVRTDQEVLVIAGSGRGADTAAIITPACSNNFFDLRVHEIICRPRG